VPFFRVPSRFDRLAAEVFFNPDGRDLIAKPTSIKPAGGKSGGCASKAVELTWGGLPYADCLDAKVMLSGKCATGIPRQVGVTNRSVR